MTTGAVVWLTGLPASGKTTLAREIQARLAPQRLAILLDSDELRDVLGTHAYAPEARDAFYATLGGLAELLAAQGHVVLVAATAPRRRYRDAVRARVPRFVEVHVETPLAQCEARDVKGLYAAARAGAAPALPGLGAPYEPPLSPEVTAGGGRDHAAVDAVLARL